MPNWPELCTVANNGAQWPTLMYRISCASRIVLLFHRHALGEVSGLVYVAAAADGYVVGEELEGDYFEDVEEELVGLGDMDDVLD